MSEDKALIQVSVELRDTLKSQRRIKPDGELETIEEVLHRKTMEKGLDLRGRKIGHDER